MNKQQKQYAVCKARLDALKAKRDEIERAYIVAHGIVNDDGETPQRTWMIDDESVFNAACNEIGPVIDALGIYAADKDLERAEDALINYGLSIAPANIRETLRGGCFGPGARIKHREKMIDLAFRLDTRTVPAFA